VTLDPDDGEGWFQLAAALARSGRFPSADSAIHYAREIDADRAGLDFLAAWIDEALGRDEAAAEGYARHLKLHPNDELTRQRRIALLDQLGRYAEAYAEARELASARPRDAEVLETEADMAYRTGHAVAGRQHLDAMMRLDPADSRLVGRALSVLATHKRTSEGLTLAREWSDRHPGDWRGPMLQAQAQALAGAFDRAIERARSAIELAPDSIAARVMLGRIAQQAKQWPTAAETWSELLQRRPGEIGFRLDLAFCREQIGDVDGALAAARDALALAPRQASVLNFIGYLMADHNRDLGEAEKMVQQAVDQEPENGAFIDSLGWVFYRLGRLEDARRQLERAVALTRGDPIVLEHLGDVYRDLHLLDLARNLYRRSIAADTSNQRVRDKLEAIR
jgi:tetratricopeptide (TPR) repeat protein